MKRSWLTRATSLLLVGVLSASMVTATTKPAKAFLGPSALSLLEFWITAWNTERGDAAARRVFRDHGWQCLRRGVNRRGATCTVYDSHECEDGSGRQVYRVVGRVGDASRTFRDSSGRRVTYDYGRIWYRAMTTCYRDPNSTQSSANMGGSWNRIARWRPGSEVMIRYRRLRR